MATKLSIFLGLTLNLASAIGIVFTNKYIFVSYGFPSMTLTLVHFFLTSLGLQLCVTLGIFTPARLRLLQVAPLAASFCGFVVFTNLSLQFNTVGTYQLAKSMTTPVILFLQALFFNKPSSLRVRLTVVSVTKKGRLVSMVAMVTMHDSISHSYRSPPPLSLPSPSPSPHPSSPSPLSSDTSAPGYPPQFLL